MAVGSRSIESIVTDAIPRIDEFCSASGMGINRAKSVILSACALEDPPLHASLSVVSHSNPQTTSHIINHVPLYPLQSEVNLGIVEDLAPSGSEEEPLSQPSDQEVNLDSESQVTPLTHPVVRSQVSCLTPPDSPQHTLVSPSRVAEDLAPRGGEEDSLSQLSRSPDPTESPVSGTSQSLPESHSPHVMQLRSRLNAIAPSTLSQRNKPRLRPVRAEAPINRGAKPKVKRRKGPRLTLPKKHAAREDPVDSIVDKRWNPNQHPSNRVDPSRSEPFGFWEYRVRWMGYGPDHDTWEPLVNLSCCLESVTGFDTLWTRPRSRRESLEPMLALCPQAWREIRLVNQTKYLGIVFSNSKNTYATMDANFGPVLEKARARLSSYRTVFSNVPLSTRILIVNVFVTSLFSYLIGFFLIPYPIHWSYRP